MNAFLSYLNKGGLCLCLCLRVTEQSFTKGSSVLSVRIAKLLCSYFFCNNCGNSRALIGREPLSIRIKMTSYHATQALAKTLYVIWSIDE